MLGGGLGGVGGGVVGGGVVGGGVLGGGDGGGVLGGVAGGVLGGFVEGGVLPVPDPPFVSSSESELLPPPQPDSAKHKMKIIELTLIKPYSPRI